MRRGFDPTTKNTMKRRAFLHKSAAAAAFSIVPSHVLGFSGTAPNDKIRLGFIGAGKQGLGLMNNFIDQQSAEVVAISEIDTLKSAFFKKTFEKKALRRQEKKVTLDELPAYRELLQRSDIDAVVIATPDHWHAQMAVDAAKAKKDIYCEKPLSSSVAEGRAMVDAARKYAVVFQTGSMQRSGHKFRRAVELIQNNAIGTVKEVHVSIGDPYRACDLPSMETPANIDWDAWIGPAPYRAYHTDLACPLEDKRWGKWRDYKPYGGGMITDWGAHHFDIVQWALQQDHSGPIRFTPPAVAQAKRGLQFFYKNGVRVTHKAWQSLKSGRKERNGIQFIGSEGSIEVSRGFLRTFPDPQLATTELKPTDLRVIKSDDHLENWLSAIRKRNKPICDVEIGHRTATVCNLSNIAYALQRNLDWNPETEQFKNDVGANLMLDRAYRGQWDYRDF